MTMQTEPPAPFLQSSDTAVLFDGTCKLCNGWARFIIHYDHACRIQLAAVQSPEGQELLKWSGLPLDEFNTIVLISNNKVSLRSEAMFEILSRLDAPWRWLKAAPGVGSLRPSLARRGPPMSSPLALSPIATPPKPPSSVFSPPRSTLLAR